MNAQDILRVKESSVLSNRVTAGNAGLQRGTPAKYETCFEVQDIRVLHDRSVFEEYDAVRKSDQYNKDFINDQDSIVGPSIINNMIKNIMCTKLGSLDHDLNFGVDLTYHLFEQLDWVGVIAIRDHIANQLDTNLPHAVEVTEVDVRANPDGQANMVEIDITYNYTLGGGPHFHEVYDGAGPGLHTKRVTFTLGVDGFTGFSSPNQTQFRRAV